MSSEAEIISEEAIAWNALHRLGLSIGCDHAYGSDGVLSTEHCIESAMRDTNQRWAFDLWGSPWLGCGKLTLHFVDTGSTYTYWVAFLTRWLSLAIHVGGKRKRAGNDARED